MAGSTRRMFLKKAVQGALLAANLVDAKPAPAAQGRQKKLKRMIFRADDVGYSEVANIGTFKAVDKGVITTLDVMFDEPGTVNTLERLRKYPWLSLGWHTHMWGKPVLGADKVPSLVGKDGHFKWSPRDGTWNLMGDYRKAVQEYGKFANEINYEEAVGEFRAQMNLCVKVLGRAPDTGGGQGGNTLASKAIDQVAKEFGLKSGWFTKGAAGASSSATPCLPQYADLNIYMPSQGNGTNLHMLDVPGRGQPEPYDPIAGLRNDGDGIMNRETVQLAFHPGFLDDYVATDGGIQFVMARIRVLDVHFLCSQELRDWLKENKIELINQRDALYGTREYQNHLKDIGSDLYMLG